MSLSPFVLQSWVQNVPRLKKMVTRKVGDRLVADDIVQDVFLKIHQRADQLTEPNKFDAWVYRIAINTITDYFRSRVKDLPQPGISHSSDDRNDFNDCMAQCLAERMVSLPEIYREALRLADIEKLPQKELASRLGMSYSGAKSRVQRARQMLREIMDQSYVIKTDVYGNVIVCQDRKPESCAPSVK